MVSLDWFVGAVLEARGLQFNTTDGAAGASGFRFQENSTSVFANELKFAAAKSVRTSIVTLASFNVLAALLTVLGICWDSYKAIKKRDGKFNLKSSFFHIIGPADVFPFTLCLGIIGQGITFAYVQSRGFKSLSILNCMYISQAMLPAMFVTHFIQLVLGVEMAIRAAMPRPFASRARWSTPLCILLIGMMLLATFLVTMFARPPNFCFASLFWLVHRWKSGILICLCLIIGFLFISVVIITIRLRSNARASDEMERLAAYRMVFYLAISIASLGCILPFFIQSMLMDLVTEVYELSKYGMVASVVANLLGIIVFGCFIFLRSKKMDSAELDDSFNPEKGMYNEQENDARTDSINSDERWLNQIQQPLTPPHYKTDILSPSPRAPKIQDSITPSVYSRGNVAQPSTTMRQEVPSLPAQQPTLPQTPYIHVRESSNDSTLRNPGQQQPSTPGWVLPAATYQPFLSPGLVPALSDLALPPRIGSPASHHRAASLESTATVQIGLRLSNVNDIPSLEEKCKKERDLVYDLNCPNVGSFRESKRPLPGAVASGALGAGAVDDRISAMSVIIARPQDDVVNDGGEIRLSPTVYNPNNKAAARQTDMSVTSRYDDDEVNVVPDPLFSRKGNDWI